MGQFIQFSQLYPDRAPSLDEVASHFKDYNSSHLLQLFCKMNIALWRMDGDFKNTSEISDHFINMLFPEDKRKSVRDLLNSQIKKKVYTVPFHRHQLLLAIKLVLLNLNDKGKPLDDKTDLGRFLLAISEHLEPNDFPLIEGLDVLEMEAVRQEVSQLYYFNHSGRNVNEISRALITWLETPATERFKNLLQADSVDLDVNAEFASETGITIDEYVNLCFLYLGHISQFDVHTENPVDFMFTSQFWTQTKLPETKQRQLEATIHQDMHSFSENYEKAILDKLNGKDIFRRNFLPLMEAPILKLGENFSITADPQFLEERIASGVYWILLNRFITQDDKKKQRALSKYFGLLHQEYVHTLLLNICDEVIEVPKMKGVKSCDFIGVINKRKKKHLLFVEAKKVALHLPVLMIGEKESTLKDLNKIFGETGFEQIYSTIQLFESGKIDGTLHIPVEDIAQIYPLLVTDRFIVEESLHRNLYEKRFFNQIVAKYPNVLPKTRPMFMSSQELEIIEGAKEAKYKFDLIDFLQNRESELNNRFYRQQQGLPAGLAVSDIGEIVKDLQPIWNELYLAGFSKHINQRLKNTFLGYMDKVKAMLFPKQ